MKLASTPEHEIRASRSLARLAASSARRIDEQIQAERHNDAGKPLLLGQHREDEIVVSDRKEPKLTLSSLLETFACEASRSDA